MRGGVGVAGDGAAGAAEVGGVGVPAGGGRALDSDAPAARRGWWPGSGGGGGGGGGGGAGRSAAI